MIRMTAAEYTKFRASLPRGPFGPVWPADMPMAVLIVAEAPPDVPPALLTAAAAYAARERS